MVGQTALAVHLGIARERLVKYEAGVVPLPLWPGLNACRALDINQYWLATGEGPFHPYIAINWQSILRGNPKRALFSKIFDDHISHLISSKTLREAAIQEIKGGLASLDELYRSVTFSWLQEVNAAQAGEFVLRLMQAAESIIADLNMKREDLSAQWPSTELLLDLASREEILLPGKGKSSASESSIAPPPES